MSKNVVSMSGRVIADRVSESLKSFRGVDVSVNCRSVWVKAPQTAEATLKAMDFQYTAKKDAWWYTYADANEVLSLKPARKPAPAQKPQAQKVSAPKPEAKPEKVYETLPNADAIAERMRKAYPGAEVTLRGAWVYVSGEKTRDYKDALKAEGLHWGFKQKAWCGPVPAAYLPVEPKTLPAPAQNAQPAPKAKAKTAKKTALKGGIVNMASLF